MSHVYRWHSQLSADMNGPLVGKEPLHLQQSDLDGACGHHCALMALMLLGYVTRSQLDGGKRNNKALDKFWKTASPYYFTGSKAPKLASFFKPYHDEINCQVITESFEAAIKATLDADGLCIIGLQNAAMQHWTLAVGIGGLEGSKQQKLLLLDPGSPPLPLLAWNATLTLNATRRGWHEYEAASGFTKIGLSDAVCLLPSTVEIDLDFDID